MNLGIAVSMHPQAVDRIGPTPVAPEPEGGYTRVMPATWKHKEVIKRINDILAVLTPKRVVWSSLEVKWMQPAANKGERRTLSYSPGPSFLIILGSCRDVTVYGLAWESVKTDPCAPKHYRKLTVRPGGCIMFTGLIMLVPSAGDSNPFVSVVASDLHPRLNLPAKVPLELKRLGFPLSHRTELLSEVPSSNCG